MHGDSARADTAQPNPFREPLPPSCPPRTASAVVADRVVYRLIRATPPCNDDFRSLRALRPEGAWDLDECQVRGLSVFDNTDAAANVARLPRMKSRIICRVRLHDGAGFIKKTSGPGHHTWWPFAGYDILARCEVT